MWTSCYSVTDAGQHCAGSTAAHAARLVAWIPAFGAAAVIGAAVAAVAAHAAADPVEVAEAAEGGVSGVCSRRQRRP